MSSAERFLVVDLGTSAVKAGVVDRDGRLLGVGTVEYSLSMPRTGWVECEAETYWQSVRSAVQVALYQTDSEHGGAGELLTALSISSQGETLLCLDDQFRAIRPAIVWLDNRAELEAQHLSRRFGHDEIYSRSGQTDSLATWPACKMLWLRNHEPETFAATRWFALLEDWLIARLTGQLTGETSMWSSSLLIDIATGEWWPQMLQELTVAPDRLPQIVSPGHTVGGLTAGAAHKLGLRQGLPIVAGGMDMLVAAAGAGNIAPGIVTEVTGSVLAVTTCLDQQPLDRSSGLPIYRHVVPNMWVASPYSQTGGLVLRWLRDNFYGPPGQLSVDVQFDAVVAEAAKAPPGSGWVLLLPHLAGAWFPEFDLSAKAAIVGLTLEHGRAHVVRAALESVAFMLRVHVEGLLALGVTPDRITSLGPSSQSLLWRRIKADVTHLPIHRVTCAEPALVGGAMLAAVGVGLFDDLAAAAPAMCHPLDRIQPDDANGPLYDRRFSEYRRLFDMLRPTFDYSETR